MAKYKLKIRLKTVWYILGKLFFYRIGGIEERTTGASK
jgi:hypothetical protein